MGTAGPGRAAQAEGRCAEDAGDHGRRLRSLPTPRAEYAVTVDGEDAVGTQNQAIGAPRTGQTPTRNAQHTERCSFQHHPSV